MSKNAVVLGGGGAKGAYEIGVFQALSKLNFKYDIITGTSVGSINAAVIAQGDFSLAKKMWYEITTANVLDLKNEIPENEEEAYKAMAKELVNNSGFDYTNLKKLLISIIDEKKLRNSPIDFGLVTVKFPSMQPLYIFKKDMEQGKIVDYILGSAAFFPAMKPHKIDGKLYIDGGYNDNLPVNMAIKKGATNIVAVNLNAPGLIKKPKGEKTNITYINSYSDLGSVLIFDPKRARLNIKLGYYDTLKTFKKLDGYKYTFKKGELKDNFKKYYPVISSLFKDYLQKDTVKFKSIIKQAAYTTYNPSAKGYIALDKESYLGFILEGLMEICEIPPEHIYTVKKAEFLIKNKLKKTDTANTQKLNDLILKIKLDKNFVSYIDEIKELIKNIDRLQIVKYIYEQMDLISQSKKGILLLFLMVTPMEFFSAIYIKSFL